MKSLPRWLLLTGFCLLIFGGKLWFIDVAGSDLPSWDAWDAEGEVVFRPWLEGWMHAKEIFHPHNEHRLIVTKLVALGLMTANHQWDGLLESVVSATIHTLSALVLLQLGRLWLKGIPLVLYAALLVFLFTLPFSWENSLFGFQDQFYFLLLFALCHVWLTLRDDSFTTGWVLGQLAGIGGLLSMASGLLSAAAVLMVLGHRLVRERRWSAQQIVSVVLCIGLLIAGWLMKYEVPQHAPLHAHSVGQFITAVLQLLAWPGSALFPWALILFVPAAVFIVRRIRSRATSSAEAIQLGLLSWFLLQCLATAYARGGSGAVLSPRYLDLLALNVALGLVFLVQEFSPRIQRILVPLWVVAIAAGLTQQTRAMWRDYVGPNIGRQQVQEGHVRDFLRTRDSVHLLNKPWGDVPYPVGEVLVQRLTPPVIQEIMPPSVRRSVPVSNGAPTELPPSMAAANRPVAVSTWAVPPGAPRFTWRSQTMPATTLPILRFRVAGDLGDATRHGELVIKSATGQEPVRPEDAPGNTWKTVNVFRPSGEWWLEAIAPDPGAWFAFTEPVEVGRWTWAAEKLLKHHLVVMILGALLLGMGAWPTLSRSRT
ncbi:MAG: hypothetical protein JWM35_489 [Verrucomicrobia bacterium]|nr:hypothetical protein [Verrucomicrobiota bacterium]